MPSSAAADLGLGPAEPYLDAADTAQGVINSLKNRHKIRRRRDHRQPDLRARICDGPLGLGLQAALRARPNPVVGILNGVDYREWDPRHDPYLTTHFGPQDLRGKSTNKELLTAAFSSTRGGPGR